MTPLDAALAFAEMDNVAVIISQYLKFDVPRPLDELLEVHVRNAECLLRLISCGPEGPGHIVFACARCASPARLLRPRP